MPTSILLLAPLLALLLFPPAAEAFSVSSIIQSIESIIANSGNIGPILFIIAYAIATVLLIPASALTIGAGFLFGPVLGTILVSISSTLGAALAFLVGRYLARPLVSKKVESDTRFAAVDTAIAAQGARIVLLLRLSPIFPFTLLNYALSLTRIPFGEYVLASWLGMIPGTIAYVALGGAGKAAAESATGSGISLVQVVLYVLGAAATLGATVLISRAASKALSDVQNNENERLIDDE